MRTLALLLVIAAAVALGPLYFMYGQVDPCRALAAQMAQGAEPRGVVGEILSGDPEIEARKDLAAVPQGECFTRVYRGMVEGVRERERQRGGL